VEAGISTCGMVTKVPIKTLLAIKGFSEAKVEKIRSSARKLTGGNTSTFKTGTEVREQRKRCIKITTGAKVSVCVCVCVCVCVVCNSSLPPSFPPPHTNRFQFLFTPSFPPSLPPPPSGV